MSQAKKQYVIVFGKSWWTEDLDWLTPGMSAEYIRAANPFNPTTRKD